MEKPDDAALAAISEEGYFGGSAMYLINDYFDTHGVGTYTVKAVLDTSGGAVGQWFKLVISSGDRSSMGMCVPSGMFKSKVLEGAAT